MISKVARELGGSYILPCGTMMVAGGFPTKKAANEFETWLAENYNLKYCSGDVKDTSTAFAVRYDIDANV